jgi:lactoylglutathione lyase
MLRVTSLVASLEFYTKLMVMKLLHQSDNVQYRYTLASLGYGGEKTGTVIELIY